MSDETFRLDWFPSSSAQLELFDPRKEGAGVYQLKYTPPFRSTIRPPVMELNLGPNELGIIDESLNELATTVDARSIGGQPSDATGNVGPAGRALQKMKELGDMLYTLTIPGYIRTDLRSPELFFEMGMDESLLGYPWELMHDGEEFLCLKQNIGRFVNGKQSSDLNRPPGLVTQAIDRLSVLLIVVPKPKARGGVEYDQLEQASREADEIMAIIGDKPKLIKVELLSGDKATFLNVSKSLQKGCHIMHFCGHAKFDEKNPRSSSLILYDNDLSANAIYNFLLRTPPAPVLCFINACETAKPASGKDQFNVFGLAKSFLETGSYLLGTRWKVNDTSAMSFAPKFYSSLLLDGKPLGAAIREARVACKEASPADDFTWASYILYGDPRIIFRKL